MHRLGGALPECPLCGGGDGPDGSDAEVLGWGLALPDHVFTHLPAINFTGRLSRANDLVNLLRHGMDVRLIWLDLEPEHWPAEDQH